MLGVAMTAGLAAQPRPWPSAPAEDPGVTPVSGPSWLTRLGVSPSQTSIGRADGRYGPTGPPRADAGASVKLGVRPSATLSGADVYRFNCQACHGSQGKGSPPEVLSATDPVRGVPLEVMRQKLLAQHQPVAEAEARLKPERVRRDVLTRVHRGGQRMPPREYLRDDDLALLYDYLQALAGTRAAPPARTEVVTWGRLGEQVVKGTCHICHDAVGARPSDAALVQGAIPSLASIMATQSVADFVTKASKGAPVQTAGLTLMHRGRMPVFAHLRDEEIAAAYVYLATYPPTAGPAR